MQTDVIIMDGDEVEFTRKFGLADVNVRKIQIRASGKTTTNGKKVCIEGDERKVILLNCSYTSLAYTQIGWGTVKIKKMSSDQLTQIAKSGNKKLILRGSVFEAVFEVKIPAIDPTKPASDTQPMYLGQGKLITNNIKFRAR